MSNHYFFPPASAYPLNRCLFLLKSDAAFRARYLADPEAAMAELGLGDAARAALRDLERDRLIALGAHPYLVFMAGLRLGMERTPAAFEHF
jgi:Aromatic-ring-opening dioxygenase LigAB, LigA subunit